MADNITVTRRARGTGSYKITSPNGTTVVFEVTPTQVLINGEPVSTGGGGVPEERVPFGSPGGAGLSSDAAFFFDTDEKRLTAERVTSTLDLVAGVLHASTGQVRTALTVKRSITAGGGTAGVGGRIDFTAPNALGVQILSGGVQSALDDLTVGAQRGHAALLGSYAGVDYPILYASANVASAVNGVEVAGAAAGQGPIIRPRSSATMVDASIDLSLTAYGDGEINLRAKTGIKNTKAGGGGAPLHVDFESTSAPLGAGMMSAMDFNVGGNDAAEQTAGSIGGVINDVTPGSRSGSIVIAPVFNNDQQIVVKVTGVENTANGVEFLGGASGDAVMMRAFGEANPVLRLSRVGSTGHVAVYDPDILSDTFAVYANGIALNLLPTVTVTQAGSGLQSVMELIRSRGGGGGAAAGMGGAVYTSIENDVGTNILSSSLATIFSTGASGTERADFVLSLASNGPLVERLKLSDIGALRVSGGIAINGVGAAPAQAAHIATIATSAGGAIDGVDTVNKAALLALIQELQGKLEALRVGMQAPGFFATV